jgi:anti-sigma factor RsiW
MMTHDEVSELLAAYSLDAVDWGEQTGIEAHLAECPRCRAELDAHREVAGAMGNSVEPLPEGLWSSIVSRLPERPNEEAPPMPRLGADDPRPITSRPQRSRRRLPHGPLATIGSVAVAAAAAAVVLGIGLVHADNRVHQYQATATQKLSNTVLAALETPGSKKVNLESPSRHTHLAEFVVVPDGRGYLVNSHLPKLSSKQVYQLWRIIGSQPISLGLLGSAPNQAAFTMAGASKAARLSVTVEPAGGTVVPSTSVVATGTV